jgi:hypothetical protein
MHRTQAEDDHSLQELLAKTVAAKERAETEGEKLGRQLRASVPAPRPVQPTILLPCPTTTTTTTPIHSDSQSMGAALPFFTSYPLSRRARTRGDADQGSQITLIAWRMVCAGGEAA